MNQDEFDKKCKEPVDLSMARSALTRLINRTAVIRIPMNPNDDDVLIYRLMNEVKKHRENVKSTKGEVYVVQGRSGIVFSATSNYEEALKVMNSLNEIESDRARMGHWENNKLVLQE
ncbi:hypothetical protein SAMN04487895_101597 [Paenibacillus sophorae]|uniref:Uncharacterized protein n=1 Tax=Paenibacillus sophorae TaxID=1333845 RepID=A0A1H8GQ98_9BACL|nr:hypothetical protein [Paenibacillus sophorae]QWU14297.1 hypothetical protein KP014_20535 [Paenibacillus sophorae]SEN45904.1 hypothetical protein SAMN04487895_101597 [Paenibacillus sophorae]